MSARERARAIAALIDDALDLIPVRAPVYLPAEAKPLGPYATFAECVTAQRRRGRSEESARKICGAIERDATKSVRPDDLRWLRGLLRAVEPAQRAFATVLGERFASLGDELGRIADSTKDAGDAIRVEMALARAEVRTWARRKLAPVYERHYAVVGEITYGAISDRVDVEIGWNLEDRAARAVVAYGGTRAGLVDIEDGTRRALYAALEDGRAAGEGAAPLARRIRQYVPAGRYVGLEREREGRGVAYRSTMIARTETTFARNVSSLAAGETAGFDRYLVFDARIGATDAECEALAGTYVDGPTAAELVASEHPNGTRSISPAPRTR